MFNQTATMRRPKSAPADVIPLPAMGTLLQIATSIDEPLANVLELSLLTLRMPHQILDMDLANIDWDNGTCPVRGKWNKVDMVYLSSVALASVQRIADSASGKGQVVTAGRGAAIGSSQVRLDRLQKRLDDAWPSGAPAQCSFHRLRRSAASHLADDGVNPEFIYAALGVKFERMGKRFAPPQPMRDARMALGRWAELLTGRS